MSGSSDPTVKAIAEAPPACRGLVNESGPICNSMSACAAKASFAVSSSATSRAVPTVKPFAVYIAVSASNSRSGNRASSVRSFASSARSASRWLLTDTYSPKAMDTAPATTPATPAVRTGTAATVAPATPTTRSAVDTMLSFAPSTPSPQPVQPSGHPSAVRLVHMRHTGPTGSMPSPLIKIHLPPATVRRAARHRNVAKPALRRDPRIVGRRPARMRQSYGCTPAQPSTQGWQPLAARAPRAHRSDGSGSYGPRRSTPGGGSNVRRFAWLARPPRPAARRRPGIALGVDLAEHDIRMSLAGLLEHRLEPAARAAPAGPEVHHHDALTVEGHLRLRRPQPRRRRLPGTSAHGCRTHRAEWRRGWVRRDVGCGRVGTIGQGRMRTAAVASMVAT
jgi:hypothetical protein